MYLNKFYFSFWVACLISTQCLALGVPGLFDEGRRSFGQGRYEVAAEKLAEFLKQTRSLKNVNEARLLLGNSFLRLRQPRAALPYLKEFVEKEGFSPEGLRARLLLGSAYLQNGNFHEALATSLEILKSKTAPPDLIFSGTLLRAESLMKLGKDTQASQAMESFGAAKSDLDPIVANQLLIQKTTLEMELKFMKCAKLPTSAPLDEQFAKDQMTRSFLCVKEAVVLFKDISQSDFNTEWTERAQSSASRGLQDLVKRCQNPPPPKGSLTAAERGQYTAELRALFESEGKKTLLQVEEMIENWKRGLPEGKVTRLQSLLSEVRVLYGSLKTQSL